MDNQPELTVQVNAVLERYGADEVMLDALLQWALNPTSMSAGYALQENSPYILDNLRVRHGLSADEARRIVTTLDATCGELVRQATGMVRDSRYAVSEVQRSLREKLTQGRVAPILRQGVLRRLKAVSEETRRALLVFNLIGNVNPRFTPDSVTWPVDRRDTSQSEFQAYHAATFGGTLPLVRVLEEAVHGGVYNRLLWISSGKSADRVVTLQPAIVPTTQELAALGTQMPLAPEVGSLLESLWRDGRYPLLRLIDVVSHSPNGVVSWDEPWPVGGADIPGFLGTHGNTVALSPVLFQQTKDALRFSKQQRLESLRRTVENALETLERKYGRDSSVLVLLAAEGETLWQVVVTGHSYLYVYLTPWLTPRSVDRLASAQAARGYEKHAHALLVVPYQSRPHLQMALEKIEQKDRRLSPEGVSLSALGDKLEAAELRIIRGRSHPLLDELFGVQKASGEEGKKEPEAKALLGAAVVASKDGFSTGRTQAQVTVSKKAEDVPFTPYRITFPPFADGRSLVFGRGPLHGKLALGFRADSSFDEDNVVACDLTNVNSGHIGIFMQIRGGKSTLSASLILQAAFQGIPVVVIDPKPDYTSCLLPLDVGGRVASGFLQGAQRRFQLSQQDQRGFDLSKDLEFTDADTSYRLRFQVVTFNRERSSLPGTRSYRAPLVVLPDAADPLLAEQCDGLANALAGQLMAKPEEKGYNALLARTLETIKRNNPTQQYALIDHVIAALQTVEASEFGKRDVDRVTRALLGYKSKTSLFFAAQDKDVSDISDLMAVTRDATGMVTLPITVVDVSELSPPLGRQKASPQREFISQLCGQIYHWLRSKRGGRAVEVLLVLDEAQNYLPNPAEEYNYIRKLIHEGAAMGVKVVLLAQNPQQVDMGVRQQLKTFVVARIPEATVRYVVETMPLPDAWGDKLASAAEGQGLVIDERFAKQGGVLCNLFTSPQFVGLLSPGQVKQALATH